MMSTDDEYVSGEEYIESLLTKPRFVTYPHCDYRVLHAPKKCAYCDCHPQWQAARERFQITFTGDPRNAELIEQVYATGFIRPATCGFPLGGWAPCPGEAQRGDAIQVWSGNKPYKDGAYG
jgi:hypothetical protein